MRRIALFSDVHGNLPALRAVLDAIGDSGVDERYCLGDLVGYGPDPAGVVDVMRASGIPTVRGNYDEGIGERRGECGCHHASEAARRDGEASYAFTERAIGDEDAAWLASLPDELRFEYQGVRVLLAHGSPRKINEYLLPDREDRQLLRLAEGAEADVVCVGHVHVAYHRSMPAAPEHHVHYVSSGSVGKPKDGDTRACWVELVLGDGAEIAERRRDDVAAGPIDGRVHVAAIIHRVPYDVDSVAAAMAEAGLPSTLSEALSHAR